MNKDIAVIELKREITFSDHVQPICLPEQDDSTEPDLIAAGWGDTLGYYICISLYIYIYIYIYL